VGRVQKNGIAVLAVVLKKLMKINHEKEKVPIKKNTMYCTVPGKSGPRKLYDKLLYFLT